MTEKTLWASNLQERLADIANKLQLAVSAADVTPLINELEGFILPETTNADPQVAKCACSINNIIKDIRSDLAWSKVLYLISSFTSFNSCLDSIIKNEYKMQTAEALEKIFTVLAQNSVAIADVIDFDKIFNQ